MDFSGKLLAQLATVFALVLQLSSATSSPQQLRSEAPPRPVAVPPIVLGNQVLRDSGYEALLGKRVGVLTNPTGVFADSMQHIVDALVQQPLIEVVAVFSPEHGFRGETIPMLLSV